MANRATCPIGWIAPLFFNWTHHSFPLQCRLSLSLNQSLYQSQAIRNVSSNRISQNNMHAYLSLIKPVINMYRRHLTLVLKSMDASQRKANFCGTQNVINTNALSWNILYVTWHPHKTRDKNIKVMLVFQSRTARSKLKENKNSTLVFCKPMLTHSVMFDILCS